MTIPSRTVAAASLCLALLASAPPLRALDPSKTVTQYAHDAWTTETGLPQNSVWALAETKNAFTYTVQALARAAEANDENTGNHIQRVDEYCAAISEHLAMPPP